MKTVFIGLGSNLGDRNKNMQTALLKMKNSGLTVLRTSSIYETEPVGLKNQPVFLNMVIMAQTRHFPQTLFAILNKIERDLGRVRGKNEIHWGPRTIDIDILFYGDKIIQKKNLIIPHPHIAERGFVLVPMAEISPRFRHPVFKKSIRELLNESLDKSIVSKYGIFSRPFKISS